MPMPMRMAPWAMAPLAAVLLLIGGCSQNAERFKKLAESHKTTIGTIRQTNCPALQNQSGRGSRTIHTYYRFEVDGVPQAGRDHDGALGCHDIREGREVLVYYHPEDPRIHSLLPPEQALRSEWWRDRQPAIYIVSIAAVLGGMGYLLWPRRTARRRPCPPAADA